MYALHGLRGLGATQADVINSIQRVGNSPYWPASWGGKAILLDGTITGYVGVVPDVVTGRNNPGFSSTWPNAFAYVQTGGGWSREATDLYPLENAAKTQQWVGQGPTGAPVVTGTGALPPTSVPTGDLPAYVAPGSQPSAPAGGPGNPVPPNLQVPSGALVPVPTGGFTLASPPGTATTMPVGPGVPVDFGGGAPPTATDGAGGGGGGAMPTDTGAVSPLPAAVSDIPWWWWVVGALGVAYVVKRRPRGQ